MDRARVRHFREDCYGQGDATAQVVFRNLQRVAGGAQRARFAQPDDRIAGHESSERPSGGLLHSYPQLRLDVTVMWVRAGHLHANWRKSSARAVSEGASKLPTHLPS